jgi:hypothetical protein
LVFVVIFVAVLLLAVIEAVVLVVLHENEKQYPIVLPKMKSGHSFSSLVS